MASYSTVTLKDSLVATFVSVSFVIFFSKRKFIFQTTLWILSVIGSFVLRFRSAPIIAAVLLIRIIFSGELAKSTRTLLLQLLLFFNSFYVVRQP